eukprot:CAMPEP_0115553872 /NCGR_PEP_ID=MMETSP0271-20121206/96996_1 /TAXON_ID=71861 /ORGANISM="Scrippsiella trochoidea, Strain CCMP3099" /LENGTH=204 /DNA_ID=CAMNT_0002987569 /DNA_START=54 /DNA_END=668 /DNA_ORIENTATION=-
MASSTGQYPQYPPMEEAKTPEEALLLWLMFSSTMASSTGQYPQYPPMEEAKTPEEALKIITSMQPEKFEQRNIVPVNAKYQMSHPERWWRSHSPVDNVGDFPDDPKPNPDIRMSSTRGALGFGQRSGPVCFQTQYQTGAGVAAHFKDTSPNKTISGYSGFLAGKYAGNVAGGTYNKTVSDAQAHLRTTSQALRFGGSLALSPRP